jgi:hypothetical protein
MRTPLERPVNRFSLAGGSVIAPLLPAIAGADGIPLRMATINIGNSTTVKTRPAAIRRP